MSDSNKPNDDIKLMNRIEDAFVPQRALLYRLDDESMDLIRQLIGSVNELTRIQQKIATNGMG